MKIPTCILPAIVLCGTLVFGQTESEIRDRIVGTWKLVSTEQSMKDGTTRPYPQYGTQGKGFLMYQRNGYMCADLVNPERPKWSNPVHPTEEEKLAAADGTFAYCGRYEIDVKQKQIVHLLKWRPIQAMSGLVKFVPTALKTVVWSSATLRKTTPPSHVGRLCGKKFTKSLTITGEN